MIFSVMNACLYYNIRCFVLFVVIVVIIVKWEWHAGRHVGLDTHIVNVQYVPLCYDIANHFLNILVLSETIHHLKLM